MAERLFGIETEYAFVAFDSEGRRLPQEEALERLMRTATRSMIHLPGLFSPGMFLQNGARFYIDCGGHPELTTPECANPWDVARYLRAGERQLLEVAGLLAPPGGVLGQALFYRHNVDYSGSGSTWGSHESYLHRAEPRLFQQHLIPHLVSRVVYTGSGGFDSLHPGIRFTLSPRVPHLEKEVSTESTNTRGILHTKDETLSCGGYHRLHLLCSESLYSELAMFLRVGTTCLVVALIEAGLRPGEGIGLQNALEAMRAFAFDPECRVTVPASGGRALTAIAIQRHYLGLAEQHLHHPCMPPWAEEVCRQWRNILDHLEQGGHVAVSTRLDWAIKYNVFLSAASRRGFGPRDVRIWNQVLRRIVATLPAPALRLNKRAVGMLLSQEGPVAHLLKPFNPLLKRLGLTWEGFSAFLTLCDELREIDMRFSQLGDDCIFVKLEKAGVLQQHFPGVDNIEHAMEYPPAIGRAGLRGDIVRRHGVRNGKSPPFSCDWMTILDREGRRSLDLSDPFNRVEEWRKMPNEPSSPRFARSMDAASRRRLSAILEAEPDLF